MAESISEGTISQIHKSVGDHVEADEEVATIETDKIDVSVNASEGGVITEILVQEGDTVSVGQDLLLVEPGEASSEKIADKPPATPTQSVLPIEEKPATPPVHSIKTNQSSLSTSSSPTSQSSKPQTQAPAPPAPASQPGNPRPSRNERRVSPNPPPELGMH